MSRRTIIMIIVCEVIIFKFIELRNNKIKNLKYLRQHT